MKRKLLRVLAEEWLHYEKHLIKESTYSRYAEIIHNHINPLIGNIPIKKFNKETIVKLNEYLITMGNKKNNLGLSNKTIKDINTILQQILGQNNISIKTKIPKQSKKDILIYTDADYKKLKQYCLIHLNSYTLGILICLNTGMRLGEICALKWEHIDLEKEVINVKYTIQRIKDFDNSCSKIIISTPKTDSSAREIPINNELLKILKRFRVDKNNYVLTNSYKYIEPRGYYRRYKTILRRLRIDKYTFHAIRHTFATRCVQIGVDSKSLSELLGHSNVKTTLTIYVHPSIDIKKKYLNKLSDLKKA